MALWPRVSGPSHITSRFVLLVGQSASRSGAPQARVIAVGGVGQYSGVDGRGLSPETGRRDRVGESARGAARQEEGVERGGRQEPDEFPAGLRSPTRLQQAYRI